MAFLCRSKQTKLIQLFHQITRSYYQIPQFADLGTLVFAKENPVIPNQPYYFCNFVRSYAAPFQVKKQEEEEVVTGPLMNEKIRANYIRLVTEEGHSVVTLREALRRAKEAKLDLVEVDKTADPPVCKIMDYHKEQYVKHIKEKERAKSKADVTIRKGPCKEIRFSWKTEEKDLKMKADTVKRMMERGYRVKCMAISLKKDNKDSKENKEKKEKNEKKDKKKNKWTKETEATEETEEKKEDYEKLGECLSRLSTLLEDVAIVESGPLVERKQAYMIVRHVKYGPSKKGGAKKLKISGDAESELEESNTDIPSEDETLTNEVDDWDDESNSTPSYSDKKINAPNLAAFSTNSITAESLGNTAVFDSRKSDILRSSPPRPSHGTENRYKRSDSGTHFSPTNSIDNRAPVTRDSVRTEPQFLNQRSHQQSGFNSSGPRFPSQRMQPPSDSNISIPHFQSQKVQPPSNFNMSAPRFPSQRMQPPSSFRDTPPRSSNQWIQPPSEVKLPIDKSKQESANHGAGTGTPTSNLPNSGSDRSARGFHNGVQGWGITSK